MTETPHPHFLFPSYRDFQRLEFKIDAIAKSVGVVISHEDFLIHLEQHQMTTEADLKASSDALLAEVTAEGDRITAIETLFAGQQATITDLNQQLKDAIANKADAATLSAIAANIDAANTAISAREAAEAAVANTGTPPVPPVVTPPVPPVNSAPPVIAAISPSVGEAAGGQTITVSGTNLGTVTGVTFGGVAANGIVPDHDSSLQVTTPPGTGTVDVVVTTPAGDSAPAQFTYA